MRDSIVHSFASAQRTRPQGIRHITSEDVLVLVLVNTVGVGEGDAVVLLSAKWAPAVEVKASQGKRTRTWLDEARKSAPPSAPKAARR